MQDTIIAGSSRTMTIFVTTNIVNEIPSLLLKTNHIKNRDSAALELGGTIPNAKEVPNPLM